MSTNKEISLALGGGGARGLAHIGVLHVLERAGYRIKAVAGTSIGAVIGALYAAGFSPDEIETWMKQSYRHGLFHSRPIGAGLIGLDRITEALAEPLADRRFDQLPIPLAVTATDLTSGREVVLKEGEVLEAVLAAIALPGVFPPQIVGQARLVDGGVLDPVPVEPARMLFEGPVVAVVLSPDRSRWQTAPTAPSPLTALPMFDLFSRLRPGQALQVFLRASEITLRVYTEILLEQAKPDVIIRPSVWHIGLLDQPDPAEVVALGTAAAERALDELEASCKAWHGLGAQLRRWMARRA
jgi:NTE family protein